MKGLMHAGDDAGGAGPLFELQPPRWPEALPHCFFAAAGNDSAARMALGYRHMHGLGVPKSCQAAVLYYQPVAEQVVELARLPNALPQVGGPAGLVLFWLSMSPRAIQWPAH